jgi:hypothetical protein
MVTRGGVVLRTDNGLEFKNAVWAEYCASMDIRLGEIPRVPSMKVLTFNYIIADLLFLVAIIMSNMNMRHYEKKSGYQ